MVSNLPCSDAANDLSEATLEIHQRWPPSSNKQLIPQQVLIALMDGSIAVFEGMSRFVKLPSLPVGVSEAQHPAPARTGDGD